MDLDSTVAELQEQGAVYGTDFVATGSGQGVLGEVPPWLSEKTVRQVFAPMQLTQLTKVYTFVPTNDASGEGGDP